MYKLDVKLFNFLWPVQIIIGDQFLFQSNMEQMSHIVKEEVEVKTEIESIFFPAELDYKKEDQQVK